jgi:hypothetical protein
MDMYADLVIIFQVGNYTTPFPRDWSAHMCWLAATRRNNEDLGTVKKLKSVSTMRSNARSRGSAAARFLSARSFLLLSGAFPVCVQWDGQKIYQKSNGKFFEKYPVGPLRDAFAIAHAIPMSEGVHGEAEEILMPTRICLDAALLLLLMQLYIHMILEGYSVVDVPEFIRLY